MPSAATSIETKIVGSNLAGAIASSEAEAARRLDGKDITLVSVHSRGEPGALVLVTTWCREWTDPEPAQSASDPNRHA